MSPWILTANGQQVDLLRTQANVITLADVSHALAQINRFNGHCARPYSVAEHSLLVLDIIVHLYAPASPHCRLAALMHDAHEAYVGDMATPVKQVVGEGWRLLEHRFERCLRSAWGLHVASHEYAEMIKHADLIALATERAQLLPSSAHQWESLVNVQPVSWVDLMSPERCAMTWSDWRYRFKDEVDSIDFERNLAYQKASAS